MRSRLLLLMIVAVVALAEPPAGAQQSAKVPRIGYLNLSIRQGYSIPSDWPRSLFESFQHGLRELGYVEGQNIILQTRFGNPSQLHDHAADLVQLKVDVIVAPNIDAARAAMKA